MSKVTRDAFLYLEPKGDGRQFGQCSTCVLFLSKTNRCKILGKNDVVYPDSSCGFYQEGKSEVTGEPTGEVSAKDAGLVHRQVRCENCAAFDGKNTCLMFKDLNDKMPQVFSLDSKVKAKACCNGQHPKAKNDAIIDGSAVARRLKRE